MQLFFLKHVFSLNVETAMKNNNKPKIAGIIQEAVDSGDFLASMAKADMQQLTRSVDFSHVSDSTASTRETDYHVKYTINVSHVFPKERDGLLCLFPHHHDEKKQILKSDSYGGMFFGGSLADMNKEINKRLRESSQNVGSNVRMGVGYGEHVYRCLNVQGTLYIVWATVNRKNMGNVKNTTLNCPLVINMDGWGCPKGIFLLKPKVVHERDLHLLPLKRGNPEFMWPKEPIFVCEKPPKQIQQRKVHFISKQLAAQLIQSPSKDATTWIPFEQNPFRNTAALLQSAGSDDDDLVDTTSGGVMMEPLSEAELTEEGLSWNDTPRDVLFEEATPRTQDKMQVGLLVPENSTGRKLPHIPEIQFMTPEASLLHGKHSKRYVERDPFEQEDPEILQKTRDTEEEIRVEAVVMGKVVHDQ